MAMRILSKFFKCVSNSLIKFGNIQNDSFFDRKEQESNNFKNHENKINSDNISNARYLISFYPRLVGKTMAMRILSKFFKCVSNSLIKFGNIQNDSFFDRKGKKSNNFKNHENKINSDNISNPRI